MGGLVFYSDLFLTYFKIAALEDGTSFYNPFQK